MNIMSNVMESLLSYFKKSYIHNYEIWQDLYGNEIHIEYTEKEGNLPVNYKLLLRKVR